MMNTKRSCRCNNIKRCALLVIVMELLVMRTLARSGYSNSGRSSVGFISSSQQNQQRKHCYHEHRHIHEQPKQQRDGFDMSLRVAMLERETRVDHDIPKNWIIRPSVDKSVCTRERNVYTIRNSGIAKRGSGRGRRRFFRFLSTNRGDDEDYSKNAVTQDSHADDNIQVNEFADATTVEDSVSTSTTEMSESITGSSGGSIVSISREVMIQSSEIGNKEFYDMIADFSQYGEHEIFAVQDARLRAVLEGVVECSYEPAAYKAFEILYEDFLPIRLAGRFIFQRLKQIIDSAQLEREKEVLEIQRMTGLAPQEVENCRKTFLSIAQHRDGDLFLTKQQLVQSGFLQHVREELRQYDDTSNMERENDELFHEIASYDNDGTRTDKNRHNNRSERITFQQLMIGLHSLSQNTCNVMDDNNVYTRKCDPTLLLDFLLHNCHLTDDNEATNAMSGGMLLDHKHQKYSDRYDEMVQSFREWKQYVPSGQGRRLDVLRGCFIGAENEKIVNALKIVYVDYGALRIAGNTIFSLMSALITKISSNQNKS